FSQGTGAFVTGGDSQTNPSVDNAIGQSMATPAPETLQELRVSTARYDAAEGGKSGAQISAITRSGTNEFHGQAYDHFPNNALNAASCFTTATIASPQHDKVSTLRYNRFGGTLGGP